jgi:hypothetical protein
MLLIKEKNADSENSAIRILSELVPLQLYHVKRGSLGGSQEDKSVIFVVWN